MYWLAWPLRVLPRFCLRREDRAKRLKMSVDGMRIEYYHPDSGLALNHKGFLDWNLLVLEMV
jgi:hypothetical protein